MIQQIFSLHSFDSKFDRVKFIEATSALDLHRLKLEERRYAEVFGAICLGRNDVKLFKGLVDERNKILHPSGAVVFDTQGELELALDIQLKIAEKIAACTAPAYVTLAEASPYGRTTYRKVLGWETDYLLEQELFTKYHLTEVDLTAIKRLLRTK